MSYTGFRNRPDGGATDDNATGYENGPAKRPAKRPDSDGSDPVLTAIEAALLDLPEAERAAVAEHVAALAKMTPAKRAAVLTLTAE